MGIIEEHFSLSVASSLQSKKGESMDVKRERKC